MRLRWYVLTVMSIVQQADGEDELKKRQLMELAIINGTYRDSNTKVAAAAGTFRRTYTPKGFRPVNSINKFIIVLTSHNAHICKVFKL